MHCYIKRKQLTGRSICPQVLLRKLLDKDMSSRYLHLTPFKKGLCLRNKIAFLFAWSRQWAEPVTVMHRNGSVFPKTVVTCQTMARKQRPHSMLRSYPLEPNNNKLFASQFVNCIHFQNPLKKNPKSVIDLGCLTSRTLR